MKIKHVVVLLLLSVQFVFSQSNKQEISLNWLNSKTKLFEIQDKHDFKMLFKREGLSGETFRYYHFINDVQVFDSSIVIHVSKKGEVTYYSSTYKKEVTLIATVPRITKEIALENVKNELNITNITYLENKLFIYDKLEKDKLVYRIITHSDNLTGAWETIIDAQNGEVLSSKDIAYYHDDKKKKTKNKPQKNVAVNVNGTGMVYDTDPLTATTNIYGGNYSDNNDATNAQLDAARTSITLLDIEQIGSTFKLKGPYVEIAELSAPSTGLFTQNSSDFNFTRNQQGFEAVNVYYHTDKSIRYINETLGITLVSLYNSGVLRYDPHGVNGDDNSYYTNGTLNFGEGGVDDAEDADVILHELGHGLHDWLTNGSLSQVDGLSEGSGDYWANSYKRSLGQWTASDNSYFFVFGWDGHNPYFNGRVTNNNAHYPEGLGGGIHAEGTIWSSVLMEIWEQVGKENTDKAFLEGLAMTNSSTSQEQAAQAVRQAAIDMGLSCDDINYFTDRFEARGYSLSTYNCSNYDLDVSINGIIEVECGNTQVDPILTIKNVGSTTVTSATINWNIDGATNTTINWTGSLTQNQSEDISLSSINLTIGTHTLNATISNPNNGVDEGSDNNTITEEIIINLYETTQIHLDLLTDEWCQETTWNFKSENGTILYSGGPYITDTDDNTHFLENFNVPVNGCYTFEILDTEGDGICCGYGNGSYTLITGDGTLIFSGGEFDSNEITEIAVNSDGTAAVNNILLKNITIYPNPTNSNININLNNISGNYNYSLVNTLGQKIIFGSLTNSNNILKVSNLEIGIYFLKITDSLSDNTMIKKIIIK